MTTPSTTPAQEAPTNPTTFDVVTIDAAIAQLYQEYCDAFDDPEDLEENIITDLRFGDFADKLYAHLVEIADKEGN